MSSNVPSHARRSGRLAATIAAMALLSIVRPVAPAPATALAAAGDPALALTLAGQLGGPMRAVVADPMRQRVYLGTGPAVTVLDIRVPTTITTLAKSIPLGAEVRHVALADGAGVLSAVLADGVVVLLDVAGVDSGGQPEVASRWPAQGTAQAEHVLWLGPSHAVVSDGAAGLAILDATDARAPRIVGRLAVPGGTVHQAATAGGPGERTGGAVAVAAGSAGLLLIDVADPTQPVVLSTAALGDAVGVVTFGSGRRAAAYVAVERRGSGDIGLQYIDIHLPTSPVWPTSPSPFGRPVGRSLVILDQVLYTCTGPNTGLHAYTLVEPAAPKAIDPKVDEPLWQGCTDVAVLDPAAGRLVTAAWEPDMGPYATGHAGAAVLDVALPSKPAVAGAVNLRGNPKDLTRDADMVWIADGYYHGNGTYGPRLVDIADERRPMQAARLPLSWQHIPSNDNFSFWTADSAAIDSGAFFHLASNLARYDLAAPRSAPRMASVLGSGGRMAVIGGRAIIPTYGHSTGAIAAFTLHPTPDQVAFNTFPDTQIPRAVDAAPAGSIAVISDDPPTRTSAGSATLRLIDPPLGVGPPSPTVVERGRVALPYGLPPPPGERGRRGWGPCGLTVDAGRAFVANGTDGLRIADVTDPTAPRLIGHLDHSRAIVIDVSRDWNAPAGASNRIATLAVTGGDPDGFGTSSPLPWQAIAPNGRAPNAVRDGTRAAAAPIWESTVRVIDVTDPTVPVVVAEYRFAAQGRRVRLEGDRVLLTDTEATLRVLRIGPAVPPTPPTATSGTPSTPGTPASSTPTPTGTGPTSSPSPSASPPTATPSGTPGVASPTATATRAVTPSSPTPSTATPTPTASSTPPATHGLFFPIAIKLGATPLSVVVVVDRSATSPHPESFRALAEAALARLDPDIDAVGLVAFDRTATVLVPAGSPLEAARPALAEQAPVSPGPDQGRIDLGLEAAIASLDRARGTPDGAAATPVILLLAVGRVDDPVRRARLAVKADALAAMGGRLYVAVADPDAVGLFGPLAGDGHIVPIDGAGDEALRTVRRWAAVGWRTRRW